MTEDDPNYEIPRVHQFNAGFEYELPWRKATLEASYVGSRTHKLTLSQNVDAISMSHRLQCVTNTSLCTNSTTNPFAAPPPLSGTSPFTATTTIEQSLKPFPPFSAVTKSSIPSGLQSADLR